MHCTHAPGQTRRVVNLLYHTHTTTTTKGSTRVTCVLVFFCDLNGRRVAAQGAPAPCLAPLRQTTVATELATALHHSAQRPRPVEQVPSEGWRASCTTCHGTRSLHPRGQWGAVTVGYVTAPAALLASPILAGGDGLDASTLSFLGGQECSSRRRRRSG